MIHLEITEIKGDGKTDGFLDQIDCSSFNWGAQNSADANTSDGLTRSTSSVQQVSLGARVGKQTLNMLKASMISQHIPKATLHFTKTAGGDKVIEWMKITMENVVVSSHSLNSSEDDMGFESTTLAFEKFKAEYFIIDVKGKKTNGPDLTYNISTRKKG
jgi:type VI secretion system secreted protein Hcp